MKCFIGWEEKECTEQVHTVGIHKSLVADEEAIRGSAEFKVIQRIKQVDLDLCGELCLSFNTVPRYPA